MSYSCGRSKRPQEEDSKMRKNSIKNRRINDEVMRTLTQIIREIKDPRVSPMTSIMDVEVAPDLKTCKVWVSVMGDEEEKKETMVGLKSASGFIRSELARTVNLRNTPELKFFLDESIAYGVDMGHRIDEILAADKKADEERRAQGVDINDLSAYELEEEEQDPSWETE